MPAVSRVLTVVVAGAALLAACSSVTGGDPTGPVAPSNSAPPTGSAPATSAQTSPTSFPSSTQSPSGAAGGDGLSATEARAALVTAADLGRNFVDDTPAPDGPLPCTPEKPPLTEQFPPRVNVEKAYTAQSGAVYFSEQIETFADADTAAQVIAAGTDGLACGSATVGGRTVTITGPQDLSSRLTTPVDQAPSWTVSQTDGSGQAVIAVQLGQHLVVLTFASSAAADQAALPDGAALTNAAVAKVAAAIP